MATNKKSFVLYADIIHTVEHLPDDKAGILFKHILRYVNDLNPDTDDFIIKLAFEPIKQALKRDLKRWERYIEKQKANGLLGGRPKAKETQKTQAFSKKPKKADSVIVSVIDIVSDSDNKINNTEQWDQISLNFKNDFRWKEKFCRDKNLQMPDLEKRMDEFISDIELREEYKPLKELKSHFTNLYNKKNGTHQRTFDASSTKQGTSEARIEAIKKW